MNEFLTNLASAVSAATIVATATFGLLRKWFLDIDSYNKDKIQDREELKKHSEERLEVENHLFEKMENLITQLQKEKADADDLAKAERKIELLDEKVMNLTNAIDKQCFRIDMYLDKTDSIDKKLDISNQKITELQLDMQDIKSRFS